MNNLKPINLDNGVIQIHPLRTSDLFRHNLIVDDLYEIFGDEATLPYNSEKIVKDKNTISTQLLGVTIGYEQQISYTHFLTLKENNKIIGEIIILSPKNVQLAYKIKDTWIIEYFLNKKYWNKGIMTGVISAIANIMKINKINKIGALVDRNNLSSIRVLEKVGFRKICSFDLKQDYFEI
ncbi:MAG: GNAT family protein [Bacteroidota bacterium]|nr:GNAT family protein [Bacteroidota bacterium]